MDKAEEPIFKINMQNQEKLDTPVLMIVFNRPDHTKMVFDTIRKAAPSKLYVAADGPRKGNASDTEKCRQTREIFDTIDWPCEVKTLFREENLGCKMAVSGGISWFFENEPWGVILEDDCIPNRSFFYFCQNLLHKYKNDTRVMHISGSNHNPSFRRDPDFSYYFSKTGHIWGWATWARAWQFYQLEMPNYPEILSKDYFKDLYSNRFIRKYFKKKYADVYHNVVDTWDYQWEFTRVIHSGLAIIPRHNMVQNIGFGEDSTHTVSEINYFQFLESKEIKFPLKHPSFMFIDQKSENLHFRILFSWLIKRKILATFGVKGYSIRG